MANRRPIFELHIEPMFRTLDRVHMIRLSPPKQINLADYENVKARHADIVDFLVGPNPMPPRDVGGPWPKEWVDLFLRWKETGFGRLASPAGSNLQLQLAAPDRYVLSCDVTLPDDRATAWFDVLEAKPGAQLYALVMEQVDGVPPAPTPFTVEERIRGPLSVTEVVVMDSAGEHRLRLPTS